MSMRSRSTISDSQVIGDKPPNSHHKGRENVVCRLLFVSEGLELLVGGLGAAVPRFRQTGDWSSKIARELWRGTPRSFMGHAPNGGEHFAARNTLLFTSGHPGLQIPLQTVHPGIGMAPGVAQQLGIEGH